MGCPVGGGSSWEGIPGWARSDHPRNVVNLNQTMDAPNDDDMRTFVGSARDGTLLERRRRNLMTSREASFSTSCTGERLNVTAHELLSRGMGVLSCGMLVSEGDASLGDIGVHPRGRFTSSPSTGCRR